jgi:hypothetical protein
MSLTLPRIRPPREWVGTGATQAITPNRQTSVVYDLPEPQNQRLPYVLYREGPDLTAFTLAKADEQTENVHLLPTGWWTIQSYQQQGLFERNDVQNAVMRMGGPGAVTVTPAGSLNVSPAATREHPMWRKPTELSGITYGAHVADSGDYFIMRGVTALGDWTEALPYGQGADLPPPLGGTITLVAGGTGPPSTTPALQRVALADTTHEENAGYSIRFSVPSHFAGSPDCFAAFYLGGPTPTYDAQGNPMTVPPAIRARAGGTSGPGGGGPHAITLHGNGELNLWENVSDVWVLAWKWGFSTGFRLARGLHHLIIQPHKEGHFSMFATSQPAAHASDPLAAVRPRPLPLNMVGAEYRPHPNIVGYTRKDNATGPGTIKVDHRPDVRMYYQVSRLYFPAGRLTDHPFVATFKLPASPGPNDVISLKVIKEEPFGTSITAAVKDADTHAPLTPASAPPDTPSSPDVIYFTPSAGQQGYYVVFTFNPSSDHFRAPRLKGYQIEINGYRIDFPSDRSWTGTTPKSVSITSADLDPTHESAQLQMADVNNSLEKLRIRTRLPIQIRTRYDPSSPDAYSVLFQGETALVHADKRGRFRSPGMVQDPGNLATWPSPSWRNLDVACMGMATRVADQLAFGGNFPFVMYDRETGKVGQPSKVTSVIDTLLNVLGYPDDMRDVPDLPVRLHQLPTEQGSDFILQPTANVLQFLVHLARVYLGGFLLFDANAGERGVWRLLFPTPSDAPPLWAFTTAPPPGGSGMLPYQVQLPDQPGPYGTNKTFIRRLKSWVAPPEGNYLVVTSSGELFPNHDGTSTGVVVLFNPNSFEGPDWTTDPDGPDYLGRIVPIVYFEPGMGLRDGPFMGPVARRLYQQTCLSQKWIEFDAPLVLVQDGNDPLQSRPRPLRLYDPITVDDVQQGVTLHCFVRSVTINYKSDRAQMMTVQCIAPEDANSGVVRSI